MGLITFFFSWQGSIFYLQQVVATVIGVVAVVIIRLTVTCSGKSFFQSFYRRRPAAANIYFLALEWANFALTAGFVFVRLVKLLIVAGLSVGRIDTPFLAKGVGVIVLI